MIAGTGKDVETLRFQRRISGEYKATKVQSMGLRKRWFCERGIGMGIEWVGFMGNQSKCMHKLFGIPLLITLMYDGGVWEGFS